MRFWRGQQGAGPGSPTPQPPAPRTCQAWSSRCLETMGSGPLWEPGIPKNEGRGSPHWSPWDPANTLLPTEQGVRSAETEFPDVQMLVSWDLRDTFHKCGS